MYQKSALQWRFCIIVLTSLCALTAMAQGPVIPPTPLPSSAPMAAPGTMDPTQGLKMALQMMENASKPLTEGDVVRFFKLATEVIAWIEKNETKLKAISGLPDDKRWAQIEAIGMPDVIRQSSDFFPLAMKIQMARTTSDPAAIAHAKEKLAAFHQREAMMATQLAQMPETQKALVKDMMQGTRNSLEMFVNYPPESRALYEKHKKKIDDLFTRMEALGQAAGAAASVPPGPNPFPPRR